MEIKRRDFLKVLGVGGIAMTGCSSESPEKLVAALIPHEEIVPGQPTWYATVCGECPAGCGMLVKTMEGRAIKVEGNPDHPLNRGRLCARGQASLQGLYNPDRIEQPLRKGPGGRLDPISWEDGEKVLARQLMDLQGNGKRVAFVTPLFTGSLDRLVNEFLETLGGGRLVRYEAIGYEPLKEANRLAFGIEEVPFYDIEHAELIFSFGADFLETWLSPVEYARQFAAMRSYREGRMGRFVYVGPRLSLTGANADEWISNQPGSEVFLALGMIHVILAESLHKLLVTQEVAGLKKLVASFTPRVVADHTGIAADKVRVLARAFARANRGLALADGKTSNGTETCLAVNLLNYITGNIGRTIQFGPRSAAGLISPYRDMRLMVEAMERGEISVLLLGGVNPLFNLPEGRRFQSALEKVPFVVSFSSFPDETANAADLILPDHTFLESWSDHEPWQGVRGLQQPVMQPLYNSRNLGDVLLSVAQQAGMQDALPSKDFYTYLRGQWKEVYEQRGQGQDFESFWIEAVRRGGFFHPAPSVSVQLDPGIFRHPFDVHSGRQAGALTLIAYPSSLFYDGRMANRPWLQELPDPLTQIVWDNWVEIHPADAKPLGLKEGDVLQLDSAAGSVELPAHLSQGVHPGVLAVPVGQGHLAYGRYAEGRGANPIPLLEAKPEAASGGLVWMTTVITASRTGAKYALVSTSGGDRPEQRGIIQTVTLATLQSGAEHESELELLPIYAEHPHPKHRWGMAIDLNSCIGCGACVVACSAENNIPIVGKEQTGKGREMSWLRIERFNEGEAERPEHRFLPMLCQQCDDAPCEPVCPVYATYHNPEGLNVQVYNRCVGTRYCSNNCPYKVRRFNWFTHEWPEPLTLQLNPDVTVREMGVMEKCTFCVQRIRAGELAAKADNRSVQDGEVLPACAQTCPTSAIVFGDLNDSQSQVSQLAKDARRYRVLEELNTKPAITYLKKIKVGSLE